VSILKRLFGDARARDALQPLYAAVVDEARRPFWYAQGDVPDTIDGRFDMVAAVLAFVLIRLETDGEPARAPSALLTELFVSDMDAQLREAGVGDVVVGKHVGNMMGALGGRLTAYRAGLAGAGLEDALVRNLYRGHMPAPAKLEAVADAFRLFHARLAQLSTDDLLAGRTGR
jgi:cytochrome b pre-mRNA-processing protein 3